MSILNGEAFLRPAIDSILAQTFTNFELIVIDNASTDSTPAILASYTDPRLLRLRNDRVLTLTQSLNKGLDAASGLYVARLDADDISAPTRLARQVEFLDMHPGVLLVGTHVRRIDGRGVVIGHLTPPTNPSQLYESLAYTSPFAHSACMFRLEAAAAVGGYPVAYAFAQDAALWLLLARKGKLGMIGEPLVDLREHDTRTSLSPLYRFTRHYEAIAIYRSAQHLPGLTPEARRLGRITLATLHYVLACELLRAGRYPAALLELISSFFAAPLYVLQRVLVRIRRLWFAGPK